MALRALAARVRCTLQVRLENTLASSSDITCHKANRPVQNPKGLPTTSTTVTTSRLVVKSDDDVRPSVRIYTKTGDTGFSRSLEDILLHFSELDLSSPRSHPSKHELTLNLVYLRGSAVRKMTPCLKFLAPPMSTSPLSQPCSLKSTFTLRLSSAIGLACEHTMVERQKCDLRFELATGMKGDANLRYIHLRRRCIL